MSILDDPKLERLASMLGMGKADLDPLIRAPIAEANATLDRLKSELPRKFREAAFELHPDRNPDDPDASEKFKLLVRVRGILEKITVSPPAFDANAMMDSWMREAQEDILRSMQERMRETARKYHARNGPIHTPTEADVRSYGEPEDEPKSEPKRPPQRDTFEAKYRTYGFGVGVSFGTGFPFFGDDI